MLDVDGGRLMTLFIGGPLHGRTKNMVISAEDAVIAWAYDSPSPDHIVTDRRALATRTRRIATYGIRPSWMRYVQREVIEAHLGQQIVFCDTVQERMVQQTVSQQAMAMAAIELGGVISERLAEHAARDQAQYPVMPSTYPVTRQWDIEEMPGNRMFRVSWLVDLPAKTPAGDASSSAPAQTPGPC